MSELREKLRAALGNEKMLAGPFEHHVLMIKRGQECVAHLGISNSLRPPQPDALDALAGLWAECSPENIRTLLDELDAKDAEIARLNDKLGDPDGVIAHADAITKISDEANARAEAAEGLIEQAVRALGEQTCPRPCNGRPDNFSVAQCVGAGECGCIDAAALPALTPLLKASRRPQNREETDAENERIS